MVRNTLAAMPANAISYPFPVPALAKHNIKKQD
jgi:hypothetical protein